MPLNIIRNDITKVSADAIVNTANPEVAVGAGVDQCIYEAAGARELIAERAKIGPMEPGQAAVTPAFALDAKYIIHTVGPAWRGGNHGEREAVASCYRKSLELADELGCESIAFPLISTGTYRFPKDQALNIAISEISSFLFAHDMTVYLVVYDREAFVISGKAFNDIRSYIEEKDVRKVDHTVYGSSRRRFRENLISQLIAKESLLPEEEEDWIGRECSAAGPVPSLGLDDALDEDFEDDIDSLEDTLDEDVGAGMDSLEDILDQETETFQEMLFRIIDRKGMTDPQVYKKANIDRKLFSKIRSNVNYVPSKKTALALAVALELNMDETMDLLRRAGLALSPSSRFDLIVGYCINHKVYNIFEINTFLFNYDEPLLVG